MLDVLKAINSSKDKSEIERLYQEKVDPILSALPLTKYDKVCFLTDIKDAKTRSATQCKSALERLTMIYDITSNYQRDMIGTLRSVVQPLQHLALYKLPSIGIRHLTVTNPSIIVDPSFGDRYIINARHVNYHCNEKNEYHCNDPKEKIVHTTNVLYYMKDLSKPPDKIVVLKDHTQFVKYPSPVQDLEDVRLFVRRDDSVWCTATSRECLPSTSPQILLCSVHPDSADISDGLRLLSPVVSEVEGSQKNWLPFLDEYDGTLSCIYATGKNMLVCAINEITGQCDVKYMYDTNLSFQQARGGSSPCVYRHRLLPMVHFIYFVHYAYDQPGLRREYYHRIVYLGEKYKPLYISHTFTMMNQRGIEFVLSCCPCVTDSASLMVGFGVNDVEAYIMQVSMDSIAALPKIAIE